MYKLIVMLGVLSLSFFAVAEEKVSLWSEGGGAEAVCINESKMISHCFIVVGDVRIDISEVEASNLGKLGLRPKEAYSKVINIPSKWLKVAKNEYMVEITTHAWFEGQRYTVKEPAYVKDGKYYQR
ncbi:hypothetical protein SAMN02927930_01744 [Pseudidiomarina indica]|uniref:Uncharacterized protein n=1 Tax=Pseudidiomarina indica TaxID=1159017 RepID=A0A1G6DIS1_9GAMM|nr:hypothetical protein [Pseudidiomarina indica]SDB45040.1 hypothetical protein SAMN02927930_01744 [Pseudidiomarina indica]